MNPFCVLSASLPTFQSGLHDVLAVAVQIGQISDYLKRFGSEDVVVSILNASSNLEYTGMCHEEQDYYKAGIGPVIGDAGRLAALRIS